MRNEILYQILESAFAGAVVAVVVAVFLSENGVV